MIYDIIVIGSGPAGCTAGIYGVCAGRKVLIISKEQGGIIGTTTSVNNYPGFPSISGYELAQKWFQHAKSMCDTRDECVKEIVKVPNGFEVICGENTYKSYSVILCTGSEYKRVPNLREEKVFYCATCDSLQVKNRDAIVIGGGNTAFESAIFLSNVAQSVTILIRKKARAFQYLQDKAMRIPNISILLNTELIDYECDKRGNFASLITDKTTSTLQFDGIFIAIGSAPRTSLLQKFIDDGTITLEENHIKTDANMCVAPGLYCAGDIVNKPHKQAISAANEGMIAALHASQYIDEMGENS